MKMHQPLMRKGVGIDVGVPQLAEDDNDDDSNDIMEQPDKTEGADKDVHENGYYGDDKSVKVNGESSDDNDSDYNPADNGDNNGDDDDNDNMDGIVEDTTDKRVRSDENDTTHQEARSDENANDRPRKTARPPSRYKPRMEGKSYHNSDSTFLQDSPNPPTYDCHQHMHLIAVDVIFNQMHASKGIKLFKEKAVVAILKEYK